MEAQKYFKVRYAGKLIKVVPAHTKWEAIDRVYNENIGKYKWILREKFTAVVSRCRKKRFGYVELLSYLCLNQMLISSSVSSKTLLHKSKHYVYYYYQTERQGCADRSS